MPPASRSDSPRPSLLSSVLRGVLFGVDRFDPATYGAVAATLAAVALLASRLPAWRAGRIDPIRALRND